MDRDHAMKLVHESTEGTGLPRRAVEKFYEGPVQGIECACGCEAVVINGVDRNDQPEQRLGWAGCGIHMYDEDGDLIPASAPQQ